MNSSTATAGAGLLYIDQSEVIEQKYPCVVLEMRVRPDSEGAGRQRGRSRLRHCLRPSRSLHGGPLLPGRHNQRPPGRAGRRPPPWARPPSSSDRSGAIRDLPEIVGEQLLQAGERIVSLSAGGGGYGDPLTRDPAAVRHDVVEGYISFARASDAYGVVLTGNPARVETLRIDEEAATAARRAT